MSLKSQNTFIDPKKVRKLFEKYDLDKNVILDQREFRKVMTDILKSLGENLPDDKNAEIAREGFKRFDLNNNHKMEFNEFYEFMRFIISEKGYDL